MRYLTQDEQLHVIEVLKPERSAELLDLMKNDELAVMLTGLSSDAIDKFIKQMKHEESTVIRKILSYPEKSAGRAMSDRFVWIDKSYTVLEATQKLKHFSDLAEYINYLYVIDHEQKLVGVVSYRDLLLAETDVVIEDIMVKNVVKVDVLAKQEEAAKLIARHDLVSIPVVVEDNTLAGIITVDDVVDIIMREADDDIGMLLSFGERH